MSLVRVTINRSVVEVPMVESPEVTDEIAEAVTRRLQEIEGEATRINTHAFALRAAHTFAADLHRCQTERARETIELTKALDRLASQLDEVTRLLPSKS
jgi:NAD-dependent oxidoreductase involved in siderophore biosynthesis